MKKYYRALILTVLVFSLLRMAIERKRPALLLQGKIQIIDRLNAEGQIAVGEKIFLSKAGIYELELIPGISDGLAFRIYEKKKTILKAAGQMGQVKALSIIHGIGPKTSGKILRYLKLE